MANLSEAYDFSLFEEKEEVRVGAYTTTTKSVSASHVKKQSIPKQKPKQNIVKIPKKELEKNRRPKINPFKAGVWFVSFCAILGIVVSMVYSQVQLTELTNTVNSEFTALNEATSKSVYLNTKTKSQYDMAEVEKYATESLGMTKMSEDQISYVNLAQQDKGEVLLESKVSGVTSLLNTVKSWFA